MILRDYIVYTANFGGYDSLKEISGQKNISTDYLYFTDLDLNLRTWDVRKFNHSSITDTPRRAARFLKAQPHLILPRHKYSIWVDSSFFFKINDVRKLIQALDCEIAMFPHGNRKNNWGYDCLYDEAETCIANSLDKEVNIRRQVVRYRKEGFPKHYGLHSTGFIIRKNCSQVNKFNELWWNEIRKYSYRDQISQQYCAWKTGIKVLQLPGDIYNNELISKTKHLKKRNV